VFRASLGGGGLDSRRGDGRRTEVKLARVADWCCVGVLCIVLFGAPATAAAAAGAPDPSFASGGVFVGHFGQSTGGTFDQVALAPGGKVDAVGSRNEGGDVFTIAARLTESGVLDPSFGANGSEAPYFGERQEHQLATQGGEAEVVEPDGSILIGSDRVAGRLLTCGQIDPNFVQVRTRISIRGLGELPGGRFIAVGQKRNAEHENQGGIPVAESFFSNGQRDSTFGSAGEAAIPVMPGTNWTGAAEDVIALPEGKSLVAGWAEIWNGGERNAWVLRLNANGSVDPSFGSGGVTRVSSSAPAVALVRQPGGRIVLLAETTRPGPATDSAARFQTTAWGLTQEGHTDVGFGEAGQALIATTAPELSNQVAAAAVDAAGNILVANNQTEPRTFPAGATVARLTPTGHTDPGYANGGLMSAPAKAWISGLVVDSAGRTLIAGGVGDEAFVERLQSDNPTDGFVPSAPSAHSPGARKAGATRPFFSTRWICGTTTRGPHRKRSCILLLRARSSKWRLVSAVLAISKHRILKSQATKRSRGSYLTMRVRSPLRRAGYTLHVLLRDGHRSQRVIQHLSIAATTR
jgi:uncharacterized delta-60 repeat protein